MKIIVLVGLLITGLFAGRKADYAQVISSDIQTTVIEFNTENFNLVPVSTPEGIMHLARLENGASFLKKGAPDLHKISRSIIIPDNAEMGIEILSSKFIDYDNISIAPSKGNISRLVNPDSLPYEFGAEYSQDSFFPSTLAELQNPYILRSLRGQAVDFHPIQYNPIQKVLRVYSKITVKVSSTGDGGGNMLSRKVGKQLIAREYKNIYNEHFINFRDDTRFEYLEDHGNMLIISHGAFMSTMQPLVDWKNKKGIPTEMIDVAEIGSSAGSIENFVDNYYEENNLTFLLLVGDIAQIPSPSISGSASDPSYGFIEGNDFYAEVIVGRFSGSTPAHIATQVERSINYEQSPQAGADWYDNALGIASSQGPGFQGLDDDEFNEQILKPLLLGFTYDDYEGIYDGSGGTDAQGINAINDGVSLINYTGHGSISSWGNGASLNSSQVNSLENNYLLPFVITVGCNVGEFQSTNECFAEAWLRATNDGEPSGAIAHYGSTISQSWEPPMHGQYGMNLIITESLDEHLTRTIGGITTNGCMYMNDAQGASGINETKYWTLFGDPSLELRTDQPATLNVSHDDAIVVGQSELSIDTGVDNALVALSMNGELLASAYSENGIAVLDLSDAELVPGDYDLVVTAFNAFPYETTISVITPEGPYVTLDSYQINSDTNNNGMADFDETITLVLYANNVGVDDAYNVSGLISIEDPYISLGNNNVEFGDIAAGGSANAGDIAFTIAHNVPDGHSAGFDILFSSDEADWEGNFNVTIHAPLFTVSNPSFTDTGGDGVWDAGEEITVVLLLNNEGSADHMMYPGVGLTESSPDAQIPDDGEFFWLYGIAAGESTPVEFLVTASENASMGTEVTFTAQASEMNCEENCIESEPFSFIFTIGLPIDDSLHEPLNLIAETGENSIDLSWDEPFTCSFGQFADCEGQCIDSWYEVWIGDGICDDGDYGVWFNCDEFDFDGGDCGGRNEVTGNNDLEKIYPTHINTDFSNSTYTRSDSREVEGYFVYRDGSYLAYTDDQAYSDESVSFDGAEYCYHITAIYEEGQSGPSNTACSSAPGDPGCLTGDLNCDGSLNILDIVTMVNMVLNVIDDDPAADLNGDGVINILDVITLVNLVLGSRTIDTGDYLGTDAIIYQSENSVSLSANGNIAGFQMRVKADMIELNTNIPLTVETSKTQEEYVIVAYGLAGETLTGEQIQLFTASAGFEITSVIVANVLGDAMDTDLTTTPLPETFELSQNFPNPFNPSTEILFTVGNDELVSLNIYDIQGRLVSSLIDNSFYSAGSYKKNWDGKNQYGTQVPSGMYLYKLESANQIITRKMVLMK